MARDFTDVELVAYLDGELSEPEQSELQRQLADNTELSERVTRLKATWELLQYLEPADLGDEFTKTTMEMAAVQSRQGGITRLICRRWKWLVGGIVGFAAGFGLVFVPSYVQNQRRLQELPIIDNMDLYVHAHDIEFVHELDRAGLFAQDQDFSEGFEDVP